MPLSLTGLQVFIASPNGLTNEREKFRSTLLAYNEDHAIWDGISFIPIGWANRPVVLSDQDVVPFSRRWARGALSLDIGDTGWLITASSLVKREVRKVRSGTGSAPGLLQPRRQRMRRGGTSRACLAARSRATRH